MKKETSASASSVLVVFEGIPAYIPRSDLKAFFLSISAPITNVNMPVSRNPGQVRGYATFQSADKETALRALGIRMVAYDNSPASTITWISPSAYQPSSNQILQRKIYIHFPKPVCETMLKGRFERLAKIETIGMRQESRQLERNCFGAIELSSHNSTLKAAQREKKIIHGRQPQSELAVRPVIFQVQDSSSRSRPTGIQELEEGGRPDNPHAVDECRWTRRLPLATRLRPTKNELEQRSLSKLNGSCSLIGSRPSPSGAYLHHRDSKPFVNDISMRERRQSPPSAFQKPLFRHQKSLDAMEGFILAPTSINSKNSDAGVRKRSKTKLLLKHSAEVHYNHLKALNLCFHLGLIRIAPYYGYS